MTTELLIKLLIFVGASAGLVYFSRKSLHQPRSHGFSRFLVFECILGLFLLNVDQWFYNPFSGWQLVSWSLLVISAWLVLHAVHTLRTYGRPGRQRGGDELIAFERTTRLVTQGAYRYIRHPMYSSLLFLALGIFCKHPGWIGGMLAVVTTALLIVTARADEAECARFFGQPYLAYKQRTRMFIPYLF